MPLVRIDFFTRTEPDFGKRVGRVVYDEIVAVLKAPKDDNFQVVTQHPPGGIAFDPSYLGIPRTAGIVFIQVTLNEGRSLEQKKAFYAAVAGRLHAEVGVRAEDVLINLVEVKKENWSFGNGVAQYAT
jgi:phenylpyruvate tautomerase PptA (4-oxalocrotonate tautomerase family)